MHLFVVGMHRSGTSTLARMVNLMGCYLGEKEELIPAKPDNPAGFWEREDVFQLNEEIILSAGSVWHAPTDFDMARLDGRQRKKLESRAGEIVARLDPHRPWIIKDPRLCLTFPVWRAVTEDPVVVMIWRRPLQVAQSLATRNGFALPLGVALWEEYTLQVLRNTLGLRRLLVSHEEIMARPMEVAKRLHFRLSELGVEGIRGAAEADVRNFVRADLFRARGDDEAEPAYLNQARRRLLEALADGSALDPAWSARTSPDAIETLRSHAALFKRLKDATASRDTIFKQKNDLLEQLQALTVAHHQLFEHKNDLVSQLAEVGRQRDTLYVEHNRLLMLRNSLQLDLNDTRAHAARLETERNELAARLHSLSLEHLAVTTSRAFRLGNFLLAAPRALRRLWWRMRGGR